MTEIPVPPVMVNAMLVRCFWRDCDYRGKERGAGRIDAFWVEATGEEAVAAVFPRLRAEQIAESRELAEQGRRIAEELGTPARPFCFLVARDLSTIDPFQVHYPFHPLWNGSSPFESISEQMIADLEELRRLKGCARNPGS